MTPVKTEDTLDTNGRKRIMWIDYAKFIGIFLVVLGHQSISKPLSTFIFAFHMPLFFFISGYLFKVDKGVTYQAFFVKKLRQLMLPYLIFNVITYLFWFFIGRKFGNDASSEVSWLKPIIGMFYGNGIDGYLIHCIVLWFLPCLFITENLFFLLVNNKNIKIQQLTLVILVIAGYIDYRFNLPRLPWGFNLAIVALVFYASAFLCKDFINKVMKQNALIQLLIFIVSLTICIYIAMVNQNVDMNSRSYNNYSLFFLSSFSGTISTLIFAMLLEKAFKKISFLGYMGRNTILIMAFHLIALSIIKAVVVFIMKMPLSIFEQNDLLCVVATLTVFIILFPVIFVVKRYLPVMIGR
ncbi:acyltransferase [Mucilaginibacter sp. UYNi724]